MYVCMYGRTSEVSPGVESNPVLVKLVDLGYRSFSVSDIWHRLLQSETG